MSNPYGRGDGTDPIPRKTGNIPSGSFRILRRAWLHGTFVRRAAIRQGIDETQICRSRSYLVRRTLHVGAQDWGGGERAVLAQRGVQEHAVATATTVAFADDRG